MKLLLLMLIAALILPGTVFAQGSIFGIVANSDLTTPANGEITFVGFIDDTDEEIRIETCVGAGYDNGNWFDDFQNYLTESPNNPYDYFFYNSTNNQGQKLSGLIPNNSFQQENVLLGGVSWPAMPTNLTAVTVSGSSVILSWDFTAGNTYHIYRRLTSSNGSFFRLDNTFGLLSDRGVADNFFIDNTIDGVSSYDYLILAEDDAGNFSPHSATAVVNAASISAPVLTAVIPNLGTEFGGTNLTITGSNFDSSGFELRFNATLIPATFVSLTQLTATTPPGPVGGVNITVTNTASGLVSNVLVNGFSYVADAAPVLAVIGAQATTENIQLSINVSATDADGTIPVLTTSTLPTGASFTDNGNGTGLLNWIPTYTDAGVYSVTFYASDFAQVDSEVVAITVIEAGNQAPVLSAIGAQSVTENSLLSFGMSATDVDATVPTLTTSALPTGAIFVDSGNGAGSFDWTPDFTQAGLYNITFYASDGLDSDSEIVTITVNEIGNQAPVLAAIGAQATTENIQLLFDLSASDLDGTFPTFTTSALPTGATLTDNGDGTGSFDWTPSFTDAGVYNITFYAADGVATDSEVVTITVNEAGNQSPVLAAIGAQTTTENIQLLFNISANDADGTIPSLTTSALPAGASFADSGNGVATFGWTPSFTDAGVYSITFYATDGIATDSESVTITVNEAGNQIPVLAAIGGQTTTENVQLLVNVSATDLDATVPILSTSALPGGATFLDNGDGTGVFDWTPAFIDAGLYSVTFYATDGIATDSEVVTITVNEAGNQTPVLATIGAQITAENVQLLFVISASDADGTIPVLTTSALPTGALFTDNGDGTGTFDWTPSFTDAGIYSVTFFASDSLQIDSEVVAISVSESGNQAPVLSAIGAQATTENVSLLFTVTASDVDATIPALTTSLLPSGALFVDSGNGVASFEWTPDFTQSGTYNITFYASDGLLADSEVVTITVNEAGNQLPILAAIGAQITTENIQLLISISATDADGTFPTLTTSALPTGAIFTDNLDGSALFDWTPSFTDSGVYTVTFYAVDSLAIDSEVVTITVNEAGNQAPVLTAIGDQISVEDVQLLINISAIDPEGAITSLSTSVLPAGAIFTDNLDGTGSFDWTPSFTDAGLYSVTFYASDSLLVDSEVVAITINDAGNQFPILAPIGPQATTENVQLLINLSATDVDGVIPALLAANLPVGAIFTDSGNGSGSFDWTPTFLESGVYSITFFASDSLSLDSEIVTITVNEAGNQPPVLDSIGDRTVIEGTQITFNISASDFESIPLFSSSALPVGATFVDSLNGLATFDWTPTFSDSGLYVITFYAADDSLAIDSETITISVVEAGSQVPVISAVADTSLNEGEQLVINVSAFDPDGVEVILQVVSSLNNFIFVDSGNGSALFTYTPDFYDAGVDTVTFIVTDLGTPQLSSTVNVQIITFDVNLPPTVDPLGPYGVLTGNILTFDIIAHDSTDPFANKFLFLNAINMPLNAQFTDIGDNTGIFVFAPQPGQEGVDTVTFIATDKGTPQLSTSLAVVITTAVTNIPPVLTTIGPKIILEGANLSFSISATDGDGTIPYFSIDSSSLEGVISFQDNGDGTAAFSFVPNFLQAGLTYVTFYALDGLDYDKEVVLIQVNEAGDQPPNFDPFPNISVTEGQIGVALITAFDPDTLPVTIYITDSVLPENFFFFDSGNGKASLSMLPNYYQSGVYIIGIAVSDGTLEFSTTFAVTIVDAGNQIPILDTIVNYTVNEAQNLSFSISASDLDGIPLLSMFGATLSASASLNDNFDGTGSFSWTPNNFDSGQHIVTFYATDNEDAGIVDSQSIIITVLDSNITPNYFILPGQQDTVAESETLTFEVYGFDVDSTFPVMRAFLNGTDTMATNMTTSTVHDSANFQTILTLTFTPDFTQGGSPNPAFYYVSFEVCDEYDSLLCRESPPKTFTVYNVNQPPQLNFSNGTGPFSVDEGNGLGFGVSVLDDGGLIDSLIATKMPTNATFTGISNQKNFFFAPDFTQAGQYFITFTAYDSDGATDIQTIEINVIEAGNQFPVINSSVLVVDTQIVYLGNTDTTVITATDADLDSISLRAVLSSTNMEFIWSSDHGSATGLMLFTPVSTEEFLTFEAIFITTDVPTGTADTLSNYYKVIPFLRGDSDSDNLYTLNDIVYIVNYLFKGGLAPDPIEIADVDNSGAVNVADVAYLVNYIYRDGPAPPQ